MILTSYMGNLKNIPDTIKKVSIMRFTPEWSNKYIDKIDLRFAPKEETLLKYKNNQITKEQYIEEYNEVLTNLNLKNLKKELDNTVLLCTCKLGQFCHRHLLSDYLRKNNINIKELDIKDSLKNIHVETIDWLSVDTCNANPDKIYVFGDNLIHKGKKGQAVIRDCNNAYGVPTKRLPSTTYNSYFRDTKEDEEALMSSLYKLREMSYNGTTIVFPKDGLGTGLANMGIYSPFLHIKMLLFIENNFMKYVDNSKKRLIIAGGREYKNYKVLSKEVSKFIKDNGMNKPIIYTGNARGADMLGNKYSIDNKLELHTFDADWDKYGKSAGYRRNAEMAKDANYLIAFWDGESKGTKHMIDIAKKKKINTHIVRY